MLRSRRSLLHALRTSLLGTPLAYVFAAALFALALRALSGGALENWRPVALGDEPGALLTGTLTATLTLAGFVLTMATLSVQFAASTYAPRLVERLRRDGLLRHTLGAALGTFTLGFLSAFLLPPSAEGAIAVAGAASLLGAITSVLLFVALLERVTGQLRPGTIFARLAADTRDVLAHVYGPANDTREADRDGSAPERPRRIASPPHAHAVCWPGAAATVLDGKFADLATWSQQHRVRVQFAIPVGATLHAEQPLAYVTGEGTAELRADAIDDAILSRLVVGEERTLDGDPAWGLQLLVDAALRALSPGVNDPTTAVQAFTQLTSVLLAAAERRLGERVIGSSSDAPDVSVPAPAWPQLLDVACEELLALELPPRVAAALDHSLATLAEGVDEDRRGAVEDLRQRLTLR